MGYTLDEGEKLILCPFCSKGKVRNHFKPAFKKRNVSSTVGGRTAKTWSMSSEIDEILDNCPNCGKSKKEIEKKLKNPSEAPKNEDILKRLRDAGLPTKI